MHGQKNIKFKILFAVMSQRLFGISPEEKP